MHYAALLAKERESVVLPLFLRGGLGHNVLPSPIGVYYSLDQSGRSVRPRGIIPFGFTLVFAGALLWSCIAPSIGIR